VRGILLSVARFFETYRFSEDLDFSLRPDAPYTEEAIRGAIAEVAASAAQMSGIELPVETIEVRARKDKLDRPTFQGKIAYRGPLAVPNWPRVLLDITRHEPLVTQVARLPIFHPYPDSLPADALVPCYALEELYAEKTRALLERTRPRDLYDVVHLGERHDHVRIDEVRRIFREKCTNKNLQPPSAAALLTLVRESGDLRADWENMLAHQLPALPPIDHVLDRVEPLLAWIDEPTAPAPPVPALRPYAARPGEETVAPRGGRYWGLGQGLEVVRFAGANRLMVEFTYDGKHRRVEPYSLRRPATGNLLLYAWEVASDSIKAFNTAKIREISVSKPSAIPDSSLPVPADAGP